jgi:hypothetical protein
VTHVHDVGREDHGQRRRAAGDHRHGHELRSAREDEHGHGEHLDGLQTRLDREATKDVA